MNKSMINLFRKFSYEKIYLRLSILNRIEGLKVNCCVWVTLFFFYFAFSDTANAQIVHRGNSHLLPPGFLMKKSFYKHLQRFEEMSLRQNYWKSAIHTKGLYGNMELYAFFKGENSLFNIDKNVIQNPSSDLDTDDELVSSEWVNKYGYRFLLELHRQTSCDQSGKSNYYYYSVMCDSIVNEYQGMRIILKSDRNRNKKILRKRVVSDLSMFKGLSFVDTQYYAHFKEEQFPRRKLLRNANKQARNDMWQMKSAIDLYLKDSLKYDRIKVMESFCTLHGEDNLPEYKRLFAQRKLNEISDLVGQLSERRYLAQCNRMELIWNDCQYSLEKYFKLRNDLMELNMDQNEMLSVINGSDAICAPGNLVRYSKLVHLMESSSYTIRYALSQNYYQNDDNSAIHLMKYACLRKTDDQFFQRDQRGLNYYESVNSDTNTQGFIYRKEKELGRYDRYFAFYNRDKSGNWNVKLGEIPNQIAFDYDYPSQLFGKALLLTQYNGSTLLTFDSTEQFGVGISKMKSIFFPKSTRVDSSYRAVADNLIFCDKNNYSEYSQRWITCFNWNFNPIAINVDTTQYKKINPNQYYSGENLYWGAISTGFFPHTVSQQIDAQILDNITTGDGGFDTRATRNAMDQLSLAHQFAPKEILYKVNMKISDLNHDGTPECYRYSISNGKLIDVDCYTLVNDEPVLVSREQAEGWLMGEFEYKTLVLYSQLSGE
jgi:hypothetical protein